MRTRSRSLVTALGAATLLLAAAIPGLAQSPAASPAAPVAPDGLYARILENGTIRVSIELNYAPYSFQNPDGSYAGFNVDVATEIASRLGVAVAFEIPSFDLVVAGSWADRWDMSVGSVTITEERKKVLDFTQAYAFNPAQMAATTASGITTLDGLAGQVVCVGAATTYQQWLEGTLTLVDAPPAAAPPTGATAFPLTTDQDCAQSVQSGRSDFTGWLSSADTVEAALAAGTPMALVGDPVFFESLGVAFDNTVADNDSLVAAVDRIIAEMRADGTLLTISQAWFGGKDRVTAG
jgi:polar amino acid transport system substrate-binding protein